VFNLNGTVRLTQSTLAGNTVQGGPGSGAAQPGQALGGAAFNLAYGNKIEDSSASTASLTLRNSILADSTRGVDLFNLALDGLHPNTATADVGGQNLVAKSDLGGGTTLGSIFSSADPQLGPLQDNGGPTPTRAITPTSPAFNQGDNAVVPPDL